MLIAVVRTADHAPVSPANVKAATVILRRPSFARSSPQLFGLEPSPILHWSETALPLGIQILRVCGHMAVRMERSCIHLVHSARKWRGESIAFSADELR